MEIVEISSYMPFNVNSPQISDPIQANGPSFLSILTAMGGAQDKAYGQFEMPVPGELAEDEDFRQTRNVQDASLFASYIMAEALLGAQASTPQDANQQRQPDIAGLTSGHALIAAEMVGGVLPDINGVHVVKTLPDNSAGGITDFGEALSMMQSIALSSGTQTQAARQADATGMLWKNRQVTGQVSLHMVEGITVTQEGVIPEEGILTQPTSLSHNPVFMQTGNILRTEQSIRTGTEAASGKVSLTGSLEDYGKSKSFTENPGVDAVVMPKKESEVRDVRALFESSVIQAQRLNKSVIKPKTFTEDVNRIEEPNPALMQPEMKRIEVLSEISRPEKAEGTAAFTPETDVVSQVRSGIEPKLGGDDEEFVIKLKPEGLGDITVKMAKREGRIVLNLVASDSRTEKLLSDGIEGLRESLRIYNAEVTKVECSQTGPQSYGFTSDHDAFPYYGDNSGGRRFPGERRRGNAQVSDETVRKASGVPVEQVPRYERSLLNRYV